MPLNIDAIKARYGSTNRPLSAASTSIYRLAHEDVPALIKEVEELRRKNGVMRSALVALEVISTDPFQKTVRRGWNDIYMIVKRGLQR